MKWSLATLDKETQGTEVTLFSDTYEVREQLHSATINFANFVSGIQTSPICNVAFYELNGTQFSLGINVADKTNGIQIGAINFIGTNIGTTKQYGLLLFGPNNSWWNPSIGYQKITPNTEKAYFPTFRKIGKAIKGLAKKVLVN